jgi:energy-coupling factor transporter ATP-binding protein EcfA2
MGEKALYKGETVTQKVRNTVEELFAEPDDDLLRVNSGVVKEANQAHTMWAVHNNNNYFPCERSVQCLPAGQYSIHNGDSGIFFTGRSANVDTLYKFPDSAFDEVIKDIESFWNRRQYFKEFGFLWKRGIMLYGPPGSGKTSLIQIISEMIIERDGIVIFSDSPHNISRGLRLLRAIEPNRPVVVVLEDIDAIVQYGEAELLALLDGELQVDNIITIATTNYPERLDRRLINRPSRFDIVKKIGMPTKEARQVYLGYKNPKLIGEDLIKWLDASDGYSMAHLKEMIVSIECLGNSFEATVQRLNDMIKSEPTSDEYENLDRQFGFTNEPKATRAYR